MVYIWMSLPVVAFPAAVYMYIKITHKKCTSKKTLTGKTAIVTGANSGIGFFTALDLANRKAKVLLACHNMEKGMEASEKIKAETGNKNVIVKHLDLSSLKSVRKFADEIKNEEKRLDILVNNAGVLGVNKTITDEGFESNFVTNHFGPFLLTNLLLELLKDSAPSRIVIVSSCAHTSGQIEFDNLRAEKSFSRNKTYKNSKLANVLFTRELARKLEGTGVTVNCLHPGFVRTQLFKYQLPALSWIINLLPLSSKEGAQTSIHCCVSEEVEGVSGKYFVNCEEADGQASSLSKDDTLIKKLWEVSEKYTGLQE